MITINLLGDSTIVDNSKRNFLIGYGVAVALLLGGFFMLRSSYSGAIARLTSESEQKQEELKRLEKVTAEVKDLEAKEAEYNNKIVIIARLKRSKIGPVRVLDDLNLSIPERSWITEVKEESGLMRINGRAVDNQTIAQFMKDLEVSNYFQSVELVETRQVDERGAKIKSFSLNSKINYAGGEGESENAAPAAGKAS